MGLLHLDSGQMTDAGRNRLRRAGTANVKSGL